MNQKEKDATSKGYALEREFYQLIMKEYDDEVLGLVAYIGFFKAMSARLIAIYGLKIIVDAVMSQDPNSFDSNDTNGMNN